MLQDRRGNDTSRGMKIALLILMVTFLYLFCVTFFPMTPDGVEQAKTITPFLLGTVIGTLIGFYYGNKHEQQKPPTIAQIGEDAKVEVAKVEATKAVEAAKKEGEKDAPAI